MFNLLNSGFHSNKDKRKEDSAQKPMSTTKHEILGAQLSQRDVKKGKANKKTERKINH